MPIWSIYHLYTLRHYKLFLLPKYLQNKIKVCTKSVKYIHECRVEALLQLCEALTLTLNCCDLFLRTCSLGLKQHAKHFQARGSIHFSLHFGLSKSCIFLNRCLCIIFFNDQCGTIHICIYFVYIKIIIHWSFQSCSFICNKSFKHKSWISQFSFHFSLKRI